MADSLREQFIKMLKILFINDKDVELLEDTEIEMCCNNNDACISKCQECKYNERIKVDVSKTAALGICSRLDKAEQQENERRMYFVTKAGIFV